MEETNWVLLKLFIPSQSYLFSMWEYVQEKDIHIYCSASESIVSITITNA